MGLVSGVLILYKLANMGMIFVKMFCPLNTSLQALLLGGYRHAHCLHFIQSIALPLAQI